MPLQPLESVLKYFSSETFSRSAKWFLHEVIELNKRSWTGERFEVVKNVAYLILFAAASFVLKKTASVFSYKKGPSKSEDAPTVPPVPVAGGVYKLLEEECQLRTDYGDLFKCLKKLRGEEGRQLEDRFKALEQQFKLYLPLPQLESCFQAFNQMKAQFQLVREKRVELFFAPPRITDEKVIPIPADGNCLYEAVAQAEYLHRNKKFRRAPDELRRQVIQWEEENLSRDEELQNHIEIAIAFYLEDMDEQIGKEESSIRVIEAEGRDQTKKRAQLNEFRQSLAPFRSEGRIAHYFKKAAEKGFWGTTAESYTIAKLLNVHLQVVKKDENLTQSFNPEAKETLTIYFVRGSHFELQVE